MRPFRHSTRFYSVFTSCNTRNSSPRTTRVGNEGHAESPPLLRRGRCPRASEPVDVSAYDEGLIGLSVIGRPKINELRMADRRRIFPGAILAPTDTVPPGTRFLSLLDSCLLAPQTWKAVVQVGGTLCCRWCKLSCRKQARSGSERVGALEVPEKKPDDADA